MTDGTPSIDELIEWHRNYRERAGHDLDVGRFHDATADTLQQLRAEREGAVVVLKDAALAQAIADRDDARARIAALEAELERANDLKAAAESNWSNEVLDLGEKIDAQTAALEARDRLIGELIAWNNDPTQSVVTARMIAARAAAMQRGG